MNIDDWINKQSGQYKPQIELINDLEHLSLNDYYIIFKELKINFQTYFKLPVHYDREGQIIFDANNDMICDIRGFGKMQYYPEPEKIQDKIGLFIVALINKEYNGNFKKEE